MFTGIIMEPGKKYSTVVENTFHLSMATLDLESVKKGMFIILHSHYYFSISHKIMFKW